MDDARARRARWRAGATTAVDVAFVIGSADGLDPAFKRERRRSARLSALTLPHGLVRVMLAEQLYRAVPLCDAAIPYHRE